MFLSVVITTLKQYKFKSTPSSSRYSAVFECMKLFKNRGFISFAWILSLSKIEKLRLTAISTNAAVIGICESKLEASILEQQISIDNYKILCCYRNRHGGVVACYVRNDLNYNILSVLPRLTYPYLLFRRNWKYFFWNFTTYLKSHNSSNNLLPPKSNKCSKSTK